jgi:hsp70-interacting protein
MSNPNLNTALQWSIKNSEASRDGSSAPPKPLSAAESEALSALLFGGPQLPSEPVQMLDNLKVVEDPETEAKDKYTALDNYELLVTNLDNANTMENNEQWTRIIKQLDKEDPEIRKRAAACCSTAVQNNNRSQQRVSNPHVHTFKERY